MKKIRPSNKIFVFGTIALACCMFIFQNTASADNTASGSTDETQTALSGLLEKLPMKFVPQVGQWVRYRLSERDGGTERDVTIGIDMAEDISRRLGYWIEISTSSAQGVPVHLRFLYDPNSTDDRRIKRFIVKTDQQPAVEIDSQNHKFMLFDTGLNGTNHTPVAEKIKTPAGSFATQRTRFISNRNETLELWFSKDVPLTGLVRATGLNQNFELTAYGSGYKAVISEQVLFRLSTDGQSGKSVGKE